MKTYSCSDIGKWYIENQHLEIQKAPYYPPHNLTSKNPSTSMREDTKLKRLKTILTAIGENGANLKVLMEALQRKDRKGFVSTYITPNIEAGYIAMLYSEIPNHPMQSYYLTNKGREDLNNL